MTLIILPTTLFDIKEVIKENDRIERIIIYEDKYYFNEMKYHKLKIIYHRMTMKKYYDDIDNRKIKKKYYGINDEEKMVKEIKKSKRIIFYDPCDKKPKRMMIKLCEKNEKEYEMKESHNFICKIKDLEEFIKLRDSKKKIVHETFYRWHRKKMKIDILDEFEKINYDKYNRKKMDKDIDEREIKTNKMDEYYEDGKKFIEENFMENPGNCEKLIFPIDRKSTIKHFKLFLKNKLSNFGDYQDYVHFTNNNLSYQSISLYHSLLSPMMNIGLITPKEIIKKTIKYAKKKGICEPEKKDNKKITINSLEGFIRQIIGWREFIRFNYHFDLIDTTSNFFDNNNKLNNKWYTGNIGILPIDFLINKTINYGYLHHIERLMFIGNFMLIAQINVKYVYKWFMEMFIDAYEWVMIPNVYEMSQFSQNRTPNLLLNSNQQLCNPFSTRPYFSSSKYIRKMSNIDVFKDNLWIDIWDNLFKKFVIKNKKKLSKLYLVSSFIKHL